jgi:hypothetical protein
VKVADAAGYIAATKKSTEQWNELIGVSTSDIKLSYAFADVEIAGKKGMEMSVDILAAAGDENVPAVKPMMEALFGADGKMHVYTIAADANTVVLAVGKKEQVAKAIEHLTSDDGGLSKSIEVQTTAALLDAKAPWAAYVSPQGCVVWFKRIFATFMGTFGGPTFTIPEYPAGPPLGFDLNLTAGQLQGEMVIPEKSMEDLAAYIKLCEGL